MRKKQTSESSGLFLYLLLLACFFIFLELSLMAQFTEIFFSDYKYMADHLKIPLMVVPDILFFVFIQIAIHLFFTLYVWAVARLIGIAFQCTWKRTEKIGFTLWAFAIVTVLLANQYLAPYSKLGIISGFLVSQHDVGMVLAFFSFILLIATLIAVYGFFSMLSRVMQGVVVTGLFTFSLLILFTGIQKPIIDAATQEKPNIIIIGIDSLRPDALGYFGEKKISPHLDRFLSQATVFSNSLTPLARTFPAWGSILTGQYPNVHGLRSDLTDIKDKNLNFTLPAILRQQGYQTIYATDETRFSNITNEFGFDSIISPPIGFNDFLLGTVNDFPLSNLIVNTRMGRYLFPYSYANRPISEIYNPDTFLNFIETSLDTNRKKPLFFAVHFCLPHTPYAWASAHRDEYTVKNYFSSINRVDQQFNDLMKLLQKNKLLEHSIIVLLSDHGEALELPGDRITEANLFLSGSDNPQGTIPLFYSSMMENEPINESVGHGTDVLSLTQHHNLLAFKLIGLVKNHEKMIDERVSLLDIKPTLLALIGVKDTHVNGVSLKEDITGDKKSNLHPKDFFIESDFTPKAIQTVHPETRQVIFEGINYFQLDPVTARFTVKPSMQKLINSSKQFADFYGDWVLALYPQNQKKIPILVNLKTGQWTNDLKTPFAQASPAQHMLTALTDFFEKSQ